MQKQVFSGCPPLEGTKFPARILPCVSDKKSLHLKEGDTLLFVLKAPLGKLFLHTYHFGFNSLSLYSVLSTFRVYKTH